MSKRGLFSKANSAPSPYGNSRIAHEPSGDINGGVPSSALRDHWEKHEAGVRGEAEQPGQSRPKNSPTLAQLQSRSERRSGYVHAAQRELQKKHHDAKSKVHGMSGIGGGVSLWPAMDDMRLSTREVNWLVVVCVLLIVATMTVFLACHGKHITKLKAYTERLDQFHVEHELISHTEDQFHFDNQLMKWHVEFYGLLESIQYDFNTVWSKASIFDTAFVVLYITGIVVLLYFLVDNMFSKSRLTPRRIKVWISLLCVVMTWTLLSFHLLLCAQSLETATQRTVHSLSHELNTLLQSNLNLTKYDRILLYWRTRCLPPTASGVLTIMGLLQVVDVAYYLQYYSLPVLTALCTPIVKIVLSLKAVYCH